MQSIRIEDVKTPLSYTQQQVVKKTWEKPLVCEISKFSILAGIDITKTEADGLTFVAS